MGKINFYQEKYDALENFYGWIDQGSDYEVAVEQSFYYSKELNKFQELIMAVTIATRFSRCGKLLPEKLQLRLKKMFAESENLNLTDYGLSEEEQKVLKEEIEEVKLSIKI